MATTKTIQPTGATITIPAFTDQPDARVFSTDVDNITDAVNSTNQAITTLNSNINNFGAIIGGDKNADTVSVPNNTGTLISTIVLTKGVWVVIGCADWASNENGYRQIAFNLDSMNPSRNTASTANGINGKETYQQITFIKATNGETINMYARQTSGGNLNVYPFLYAVRVGTNA